MVAVLTVLLSFGCGSETQNSGDNSELKEDNRSAKVPAKEKPQTATASDVDVIALANKSKKSFDKYFGDAVKTTKIKDNPKFMPGEYREYRVKGHPKGLSVRFYRNKAKRFNLLLGSPEKSASAALKTIFKIDVRKMKKIVGDPLSETWKGKSGSIVFKTAYAKRDKPGGSFIMLHTEVKK